jgi:DtxR family transcriptional regulator, Mn-dependent transcriptional regulator
LNKKDFSMLSYAEENYLKTIYHLSNHGETEVSTNAIAEVLNTKPASVTDMLKKLALKNVIRHVRYQGVTVSEDGKTAALSVIRKHRLWEVFLVEKLKFNWDEVHDVAEQLEHINSPLLIERLDEFLGFPKYDPHGDPIPDAKGQFTIKPKIPVLETQIGQVGIISAVTDSSTLFLQYLDKIGIYIGAKVKVLDKIEYDNSIEILLDNKRTVTISKEASKNLMITEQ